MINRDKLKEFFPEQADNDRYKIPEWMLRRERLSAPRVIGIPCMIVFVLNAVLIAAFWKKQVSNKSLEATPPSGGAPQL